MVRFSLTWEDYALMLRQLGLDESLCSMLKLGVRMGNRVSCRMPRELFDRLLDTLLIARNNARARSARRALSRIYERLLPFADAVERVNEQARNHKQETAASQIGANIAQNPAVS